MTPRPDPDTLDPAAAAELAALDAALAGDAADPEWAALVAAVRDEAPAPRAAFSDELGAHVASGFPRTRPSWLRAPRLHAQLVSSLAVAACIAVMVGVVGFVALGGDTGDDQSAEAPTTAALPAAGAASGAASEAAPAPVPPVDDRSATPPASASPGAAGTAPTVPVPGLSSPTRKVERTTTLALRTDAAKLQEAAGGIVRATQDLGGVVATSRVESSPAGGEASFVLRIPTARLDDALKRFGELADVRRLSQGSVDITAPFVSARDRLSDARAERRALLTALGKAESPRAIASLRARIRGNRAEVARLEGDLRGLRRRADLARVDVTLRASGAAAVPDTGGGWGPGDAAGDALRVLAVVAGVLLVAGAVLLPLGLLGAAAALAARGLRRRRRDAALGT